jgi:dTDP-4-amino-4,6-dideoxygalactose transaminase
MPKESTVDSKTPSKAPSAIPFSRPGAQGNELKYLQEVLESKWLAGDGSFTKRCHRWLEETTKTRKALLTHSCTAALEMSAILLDLKPGDEVIMPSFNFVSTANAVALRGATPVFVDIRPDTLNIDEKLIEGAITPKTRAIFVIHYAGVGCEMDTIMDIAARHKLIVLEDAAQGLLSYYKGRALGTIGALGSLSFHETKNVVSGEGGALLINDERFAPRAEIIREKGTNRSQFFRGQVDKYTWVDLGSSYLPSELIAAVLFAQLEVAQKLTDERLTLWHRYNMAFADLESSGHVMRPVVPSECKSNGHIFYLITRSLEERTALMAHLKGLGVAAPFHYISLHTSPAGKKYGRSHGLLPHTESLSDRMLRLPLWPGLSSADVDRVSECVHGFYRDAR